MAFVKSAWRILVAVKDGLVLLALLLFFGLLYAALSYTPRQSPPSHGALLLDLDGVVVEQPQETNPFQQLSGQTGVREYRLRDVVRAIEAGTTDDDVKAIVLDLDGFMGGGQVTIARIGAALDKARGAGKPVLAFATAYTDDGYQLAAHAGEVWVNPVGGVMLTGPGGTQLYYKGLIDKLGINAHVYRVGTYKSFVEPFTRTEQSPEARAANQELAGALWADWQADVAKARPKARLAAYIADPVAAVTAEQGDLARTALAAGLVDKLGDGAAFGARVAKIAGADSKRLPGGYAAIPLADYVKRNPVPSGGKVGVVTIAGDIVDGDGGPGQAAGDTVAGLIRKAIAANKMKALVVRVDSPGGSVLASEKIRSAILEAKNRGMPVVTSMGNVAASGGYWVSTPASLIFAEPATVTGSIGVFGILPSFEGSLAKIGITTDGVKTTRLSGEPDLLAGTSREFDRMAQMGVESIYGRFLKLVGDSRRMAVPDVDKIAQGRVWDGARARDLRLVDRFGGIDEAVAEAARLAKLEGSEARPVYIEKEPDRLTKWFMQMTEDQEDDSAREDVAASDWLSRQAQLRRYWALTAATQAETLLTGSAIRASCLECRALTPMTPRAQDRVAGRWTLLAWLTRLI